MYFPRLCLIFTTCFFADVILTLSESAAGRRRKKERIPQFLSFPQSHVENVHGSVKFECDVENLEDKVITWHKIKPNGEAPAFFAGKVNIFGDQRMMVGENGFHLIINNINQDDSGAYFCKINYKNRQNLTLNHKLRVNGIYNIF